MTSKTIAQYIIVCFYRIINKENHFDYDLSRMGIDLACDESKKMFSWQIKKRKKTLQNWNEYKHIQCEIVK